VICGPAALARAAILPPAIPRRIYEEFYSSTIGTGENTAL
jgi:hypothetical protein